MDPTVLWASGWLDLGVAVKPVSAKEGLEKRPGKKKSTHPAQRCNTVRRWGEVRQATGKQGVGRQAVDFARFLRLLYFGLVCEREERPQQ